MHYKSQVLKYKNFIYESLTLSWRRPLSYRKQSIDLLGKSMVCFLYSNDLRHEGVKWIYFSSFKKKKTVDIRWKKLKNLLALLISTFSLPPPPPLPRKIKSLLAEANMRWFCLNKSLWTKIFQMYVSFLITYFPIKELQKHPFVGAFQNSCLSTCGRLLLKFIHYIVNRLLINTVNELYIFL